MVAEHLIATDHDRRYRPALDNVVAIPLSPAHLPWRSIGQLPCPAQAAILSARCRFSLSTAEVLCCPADTFFALCEQERPTIWRWAVYGTTETALHEGTTSTRKDARAAAVAALLVIDPLNLISP